MSCELIVIHEQKGKKKKKKRKKAGLTAIAIQLRNLHLTLLPCK